jgi:hypothetical protein
MTDLLDDEIKPEKSTFDTISKVIRWVAISFFIAGMLFKFQHWPGASILLLVSIILGCLSIALGFIKS